MFREGERLGAGDEIVPGDRSGGTNTSHTMLFSSLERLFEFVGPHATADDITRAVVSDNILGKRSSEAAKRELRALRELYLLRPDAILYRALRDLWPDDPRGRPLLAGLCALARDPVFRATAGAILETDPGDSLTSGDLAREAESAFPDSYNESSLAKIGRNTFSSWEQTGHLEPGAKKEKIRRRPVCTASTTAYALMLGYLEGTRGEALFDTFWARALDHPRTHLFELAAAASQRNLIDFRRSGGITEVGFTELLRPLEGRLA